MTNKIFFKVLGAIVVFLGVLACYVYILDSESPFLSGAIVKDVQIVEEQKPLPLDASSSLKYENKISETPSTHVREIKQKLSELARNRECVACQPHIPIKQFCSQYPGKYGCPSYIMIGIVLLGRPGYTKFSSSVLRRYNNIAESDIHLFDDASNKFDISKLRSWYGQGVKYTRSDGQQGREKIIKMILEHFVKSNYKLLLLLDDDMILLKDWMEFIEEHIAQTDGILSLYHPSVNHSYSYDCEGQVGKMCIGSSIGDSGFVLTKSIAQSWLSNLDGLTLDQGWNKLILQDSITLYYPVKSLSLYFGQKDQDEENCGTNEVAHRFNRCEYPSWIKDQIEFYFDRCTSPDEIYPDDPNSEEFKNKMKKRFWVRPAISYSFYGQKTRYVAIAHGNAARLSSVYPGWKIWLYHDSSVPGPYLQTFCEYDARLIDMTHSKLKNQMSWRFLAASEPVKRWAIRDIDSYLIHRGKATVDQWIASGKNFHIIRDHPNHSQHPINGGSWGGNFKAMPNMKEELEKYVITNAYMEDMNFLRNIVWPVAKKSAWINDAHSIHKYGEDHPFPTKLDPKYGFVCRVALWP